MRNPNGLVRGTNGQAVVEFAMFLSITMLFLVGIADYAIFLHHEIELAEAAAAGAAFGALPGNQENLTAMQSVAAAAAPDVSNLTVTAVNVYSCTPGGTHVVSTATCTGGITPIMYVQVNTSATVPPVLKWTTFFTSLALQGQATYRVPWTR